MEDCTGKGHPWEGSYSSNTIASRNESDDLGSRYTPGDSSPFQSPFEQHTAGGQNPVLNPNTMFAQAAFVNNDSNSDEGSDYQISEPPSAKFSKTLRFQRFTERP